MAKDSSEVSCDTARTAFYVVLYPSLKKAALDLGYALAVHGSMASDMDLIAVPWVEDAGSVEELVQAMSDCLGPTMWSEHHLTEKEIRPHNRVTYVLSIYSDWHIDLSIIQPTK